MKVQFPLIFIFLFVFNCGGSETYTVEKKDGVRYVHNFSPKWGDEERITLQFIQQIGGSDTTDEKYLFFRPLSAATDEKGNIFILDNGEKHIKKFTADGKYLMTIGRPGQGPGEFTNPMVTHVNNKILVCADQDGRFQKFSTDGRFIETYRPDFRSIWFVLLNNSNLVLNKLDYDMFADQSPALLKIVDSDGNSVSDFCDPVVYKENLQKSFTANSLHLAKDSEDNILIAFSYQNRVDKYSQDGNLIFTMDRPLRFKLTYEMTETELNVNGRSIKFPSHRFSGVSSELGVDTKDRIWVLSFKKTYEKGNRKQDILEYEVFDSDGVLLTRVPIPDHRFDNIVQSGDMLFFMDPFETASVFEYRIVDLKQ